MEEKQAAKKPHDAFFRWLFADVKHLRYLLEFAGKINIDVGEFLAAVNLDTLVRIPDSYSEVYETGDADLAFRTATASLAKMSRHASESQRWRMLMIRMLSLKCSVNSRKKKKKCPATSSLVCSKK